MQSISTTKEAMIPYFRFPDPQARWYNDGTTNAILEQHVAGHT